MAGLAPDLQSQLDELDKELDEGDITQKGYQKRRTQLLSQYGPPSQSLVAVRQSPDPSAYQTSDGHRAASLAALGTSVSASSPHSSIPSPTQQPHSPYTSHQQYAPSSSLLSPGGSRGSRGSSGPDFNAPSMANQHRDSLFLSPGNDPGNEPPTRTETMVSTDYAFKPEQQGAYMGRPDPYESRSGTLLNAQGFFSDFAGQQSYDHEQVLDYDTGGPPQRYPPNDAFSPTAAMAPPMLSASDLPPPEVLEYQMPLEPREVPFAIYDPHDGNTPMSKFDNIAAVLRHRGRTNAKSVAYWVLDSKGKEIASITWDKLASKAEKVAQVIRDKSSLYRGDRVALVYRDSEIIDFAIGLLGCFIAGVVAVPINDLEDYRKLTQILQQTQAHLALTTDNNLKQFQRDITTQKLTWPKGVEWWKTNEFGSFHPKRKDDVPPLSVPDLAYIEFSRAPTGDIRGVVLSHRTIMHQMACLSAILSTVPTDERGDTFNSSLRDMDGRLISKAPSAPDNLLSYLDPRQGIGMILGVLLNVYGGHTTTWLDHRAVELPGLYAHLITKHKATLMVADYPGLKRAAYNYQQDPMTTRNFKKQMEPNFSLVKLCLIDTLTVDSEFHEVLADRWLRPLRNPRAREIVAPMLCLPEHGGMVIGIRDWLGGEERMGCPLKLDIGDDSGSESQEEKKEEEKPAGSSNGFGSLLGGGTSTTTETGAKNELGEVLLDREALKTNEVVVVALGEEARKKAASEPATVRVGAFGYPIPDATIAVVDPETGLLCSSHAVGEIWVDSPSLSGGFWAMPKHTEQIFHARPFKFEPGDPTPTSVEPEFLRTGLLGTIIEGKIFVLGLYEDRIRQKVEWVEHGHEVAEHRYFFVQHIIVSIMKNVAKIFDCSAFDVFVNEEYLPIVVLESQTASTAPTTSGGPPRQLDTALLDSIAERCMDVLMQEHHLRVYCVMITPPSALPRVLKNGRKEIGNMLCRRDFDTGSLPCVHVKFGVEHAVLNLPIGIDPMGGIWSQMASEYRAEVLVGSDKQYSGIDRREVVIDDRTSTPLNNFMSITDLIQWRVARQPEELSYCTIDSRGKEGKGITWKKFDTRVAAVAVYLKNKIRIRAGDHVILMYTHSEEFVFAIHACINLGVVVIPIPPMDQNRLNEDVPAFLHLVGDYRVKAVLVNQDVDQLLKMKPVAQHLKQSAQILKIAVPSIFNTSKPAKQNSGLRDLGITMEPAWVQPGYPVIVWTYWTPDQRRIAVQLGHDTILGMCKVQKETCQMTSSRPVLGCVRSSTGLGFIHTCLMGIYIGTPTYLISPVDFAQNPVSLFLTLSRYKIKDTYATPQMLDHAMAMMQAKGFTLHELKNMMITADARPRVDVFQRVRLHFAGTGLDRTAINTVYSHILNPMVASRSYMCIEPIELWLDTKALRRGLVLPQEPDLENNLGLLMVQDSGMVPVSTQIAIVNPESRLLCHDGEYGEIWVDSEACVKAFYGSKDAFDRERFDGRTVDGDPNIAYVRTGDLGFLHNVSRPIGPNGAQVDMQVLFVLGGIGETFEINGLSHFPMDIEMTVERAHRMVTPNGCAVFQAGGLVVVLVEVVRKAYLAALVPVIVDSILNEHQIVVDIVAFVNRGDFPRSRLGEKQRGKILAGWVTRKLRTMAQFSIRDMSALLNPQNSVPGNGDLSPDAHRGSTGSIRSSGIPGSSSLRNVEPAPQILEQRELEQQMDQRAFSQRQGGNNGQGAYGPQYGGPQGGQNKSGSLTISNPAQGYDLPDFDQFGDEGQQQKQQPTPQQQQYQQYGSAAPAPLSPNRAQGTPQIHLPSVDGRETDWGAKSPNNDDEADWTADAIMHMNLAGDMQRRGH